MDLVLELNISFIESLLGWKFAMRTLDERLLILTSPREHITTQNDVFTVENEGMPLQHNPQQRGDLLIKVNVSMPSSSHISALSASQLAQLQALLPAPMHSVSDSVAKAKCRDFYQDERDTEIKRAVVYDAEAHEDKQRQRHEAARSHRSDMEDDEEGGHGQTAQCRSQ